MSTTTGKYVYAKPEAERKKGYDYPLLRPGQVHLELHTIADRVDEKYGNPQYNNVKLRFAFRMLVAGADKAETLEAQNAFRAKGHGRFFDIETNPVVAPPRDEGKASNLYKVLCILLNDGDPLTEDQMGRTYEQRGMKLEEHIETLKQSRLQVIGVLETRSRKATPAQEKQMAELAAAKKTKELKALQDSLKYNKLVNLVALVPPDEYLPAYKPFEKPYDPREADDDASVVCSVTGMPIRGFEGKDGWISNGEWAAMQAEIFGVGFTLDVDGTLYPPPYSQQYYWAAKNQNEGKTSQRPTAPVRSVVPAGVSNEDDDIPF